jgi:hypothetical protein
VTVFVHEVHDVAGRDEDMFDAALRDVWAPALAESGDARVVWACRQAHGTGPSYRVVTYTAVRSLEAWGDLADRAARGDLRATVEGLDRYRHATTATLLAPVRWSPLQDLDLDTVPPEGDGPSTLFMEDTAWPFRERLEDYLAQAGQLYAGMLAEGAERGTGMLEMVAAFQPLWGTGPWRQVVLWQRVTAPDLLLAMFQTEVPPRFRAPGTWMHDALELRDQWESRLLRTLPWSPLT